MLTFCGTPVSLGAAWQRRSAEFDTEAYARDTARRLGVSLPTSLQSAAPKRQAEYVAGRVCLYGAIRDLGYSLELDVGMEPTGLPRLPNRIVASVTHTNGFASAWAGHSMSAESLGIDAEVRMQPATWHTMSRHVASSGELRANQGRLSDEDFGTVLFSAKEAFFKCLYPIVKKVFRFQDVSIQLIGSTRGSICARLLAHLGQRFNEGFRLRGSYEVGERVVYTAVELLHESFR